VLRDFTPLYLPVQSFLHPMLVKAWAMLDAELHLGARKSLSPTEQRFAPKDESLSKSSGLFFLKFYTKVPQMKKLKIQLKRNFL